MKRGREGKKGDPARSHTLDLRRRKSRAAYRHIYLGKRRSEKGKKKKKRKRTPVPTLKRRREGGEEGSIATR